MYYKVKRGVKTYSQLLGSLSSSKDGKTKFLGNLIGLGFKGDKEAEWKRYLKESKKKK